MSWNLTLLAVHVLAAFGFVILFKSTPDALQRVVMGLLVCSSLVMVYAYACAVWGRTDRDVELVRWIAQEVEHPAILLYVFRLYYIERILCKTYCPPSQLSQH